MDKDSADKPLTLVFMPSLVSVLLSEEKKKGARLTESEVLAIRDKAICVAIPQSGVGHLREQRGYDDLDSQNAWKEWQIARDVLNVLPENSG